MINTKVVNLFGGPSVGKSMISCGLYYHMKLLGENVELAREYVKEMVWRGEGIETMDQFVISANQWKKESLLYEKVDYIVTDSPLLLGPVYEAFYDPKHESKIFDFINSLITNQNRSNVERYNFMLLRDKNKKYSTMGRYQTEDSAVLFDNFMLEFLSEKKIPFIVVDSPIDERVNFILKYLNEN